MPHPLPRSARRPLSTTEDRHRAPPARGSAGAWLRIAALPALLGAAALVAWQLGYFDLSEPERLRAAVARARALPWIGPTFVALYVAAVALGLPATPLTLFGGAVFGFARGAFFGWLGGLVGAVAAYWIGRGVGAGAAWRLLGRYDDFLRRLRRHHSVGNVVRLQAIPVIPFLVVNYGCALAGVPFVTFLFGTAIGVIPGTIAYSFAAERVMAGITGTGGGAVLWTAAGVTLAVGLSFVPTLVARRRPARRRRRGRPAGRRPAGTAVALSRDTTRTVERGMADNRKEREGLGDDQGTRVGKPEPGRSGSLGMGAEAAEGIHGVRADDARNPRDASDSSSLEGRSTGREAQVGADDTAERTGSEPLTGREHEHRSGYGGSGGKPVTSSHSREAVRGAPPLGESEGSHRDAGDANRRPRGQQEED